MQHDHMIHYTALPNRQPREPRDAVRLVMRPCDRCDSGARIATRWRDDAFFWHQHGHCLTWPF